MDRRVCRLKACLTWIRQSEARLQRAPGAPPRAHRLEAGVGRRSLPWTARSLLPLFRSQPAGVELPQTNLILLVHQPNSLRRETGASAAGCGEEKAAEGCRSPKCAHPNVQTIEHAFSVRNCRPRSLGRRYACPQATMRTRLQRCAAIRGRPVPTTPHGRDAWVIFSRVPTHRCLAGHEARENRTDPSSSSGRNRHGLVEAQASLGLADSSSERPSQ